MEFFILFGIGMGIALLLRKPSNGRISGDTAMNSYEEKEHNESQSGRGKAPTPLKAADDLPHTIHRSTQLLTDEESEEAAEALRAALGKRR